MKHFLKHIGLLLLSFIGIAALVSLGSLWSLRNSSFYKSSFLVNSVKEESFDYIVLGSSVGLTTLDTKLIDSINGYKGINLSIDDTGMSSQYLMLEHFLAEGKKTKYCILVPGISALENKVSSFGDNDYRFLMYVNRSYVYDYYRRGNTSAARVSYMTKWLPFVGLSYYNTELFFPSLQTLFNPEKRNRFDENGNYTYPKRNKKFSAVDIKTKQVDFDHPYLNKIENLCKANNIKLIYYFAPMRSVNISFENQKFSVINHSQTLENDILFYDDIHVNSIGRERASGLFANSFLALVR